MTLGLRSVLCLALLVATTSLSSVHASNLRHLEMTQANIHDAMLAAVNAERAKQGLKPVCFNRKLQKSSQLHSEDQAKTGVMSHTGSTGSTMAQRIDAQGFKWNFIAENVAAGQPDVKSVMQSWMDSPSHRENILSDVTMVGFGVANNANSPYKIYWTQDFGRGIDGEVCDGSADTPAAESDTLPPTTRPSTPAPTTTRPSTPAPTMTTPAPTTTAPPPPTTTPVPTTSSPAPRPAPSSPAGTVQPSSPEQNQQPPKKACSIKKHGKKHGKKNTRGAAVQHR